MKADKKKILGGIKIVLVLALLWRISGIFTTGSNPQEILGPNTATGIENPPITSPADEAVSTEIPNSEIIRANIFAAPESGAASDRPSLPAPTWDSEMISKKLGIRLVGIVSGNPIVARAIILDTGSGITTILKVEEKIDGATITEIKDDAVVLTYMGKNQTLQLANSSPQAPDQPSLLDTTNQVAEKNVPVKPASPISERAGYVEKLLSTAQFAPYVVGDQVDGIQITGLDKMPEAKHFGFKEGDIIRIVNGQILSSKQKAFQVFRKARAQSAIDIELMRNGRVEELSFKLR